MKKVKIIELILDSEDKIGRELHPDYQYSFITILGRVSSIGNAMRYLTFKNFSPDLLNTEIPKDVYIKLKRSAKNKLPNYWEIVKLIATDRILADKKIIWDIKRESKDNNLIFKPMTKVRRGIIIQKTDNVKLRPYGPILKSIVSKIDEIIPDNVFKKDENKDNEVEINQDKYKKYKLEIKNKIWEDIEKRKEGELFTGFESINKITDKDVKDWFLR